MGRKIPAKKHRGVKDPLEQQARRLQSLKGKINAPPKDPDEQPVPRSLTRLFAFQNRDSSKHKKRKQVPAPTDMGPASGVGDNPVARLKKLPGESGRGFSLRINSAIRALHDPLEQDYPQDEEAADLKGETIAAQRARRLRKHTRATRAAGRPPAHTEKLTRGQKLTLKKNAKKQKAAEGAQAELVYERVAFGDVTHAPPALPAPRRAPAPAGAPRPGRRELLLSALLPGGTSTSSSSGSGSKLRDLPAAEQQRRERARLAAVDAYRQLKKQKQLQQNTRKKKSKS